MTANTHEFLIGIGLRANDRAIDGNEYCFDEGKNMNVVGIFHVVTVFWV